MYSTNWYLMTPMMPICFTICVLLIIAQIKSFAAYSLRVGNDTIYTKKRELCCLYGEYVMGAICAIQCFLCHISDTLPPSYCIYGMSVCVIFYAATKSFLYGFFLERAKCIESNGSIHNILPAIVIKYILPIYIFLYFCLYLILCPLTFRGEVIDISLNENKSIPTACLFDEYQSWVFLLSVGIDLFNLIFFLWSFTYPLYIVINKDENLGNSSCHQKLKRKFIKTMKWNIVCSSICSISSVTFFVVMSFAKNHNISYYLWFGGDIDIMINSICVFLMVGCNRRYILNKFSKPKRPPLELKNVNTESNFKEDEERNKTDTNYNESGSDHQDQHEIPINAEK